MRHILACVAFVVAFGRAQAVPAQSDADSERVVVSAVGQGARFLSELEQELRASSFTVIERTQVGLEPQAMTEALVEANAARGVRISDDGVAVFSLTGGARSLRLYGEHLADLHDRLARRRQWISLVERLRVPPEDDAVEEEESPVAPPPPAPAVQRNVPVPTLPTAVEPAPLSRPASLGAAATLGYARGNSELLSHLLLTGQKAVSPRFSLYVAGLWPLVAGERVRDDVRSRAWTFTVGGGALLDLGPSTWPVQPFVGLGVGLQFLVVYVDYQAGGQSDVEKTLSGVAEAQLGTRINLRPDMALLIQFSGARVMGSASSTRTLADTWLVRSSLGVQIDF